MFNRAEAYFNSTLVDNTRSWVGRCATSGQHGQEEVFTGCDKILCSNLPFFSLPFLVCDPRHQEVQREGGDGGEAVAEEPRDESALRHHCGEEQPKPGLEE